MTPEDFGDFSPHDLFRMEAEGQVQSLIAGLLALERDDTSAGELETCMRAAHSIKGAARIIGLESGVLVAHAMEDCFVAAQNGRLRLSREHIDRLLGATDLISRLAESPANGPASASLLQTAVDGCLAELKRVLHDRTEPGRDRPTGTRPSPATAPRPVESGDAAPDATDAASEDGDADEESVNRVLRVTAGSLSRLLGLASESLVESRWVRPFADSLHPLKRTQQQAAAALDLLRDALAGPHMTGPTEAALADAQRRLRECQQALAARIDEIERFERRSMDLSHRLYDEALACRMRPFADGTRGLPRMVRDLARSLGKRVRLESTGEMTQVDRDILAALDAPLGHLLRNAVDHGIETPEERRAAGKDAEGIIRLDARHHAGMLQITVADDGRGVDLDALRSTIVARNLTTPDIAAVLNESELLEFLFLPGFTLKDSVTQVSGRGVGLDVVRETVRSVRGSVRIVPRPGGGTAFQLALPVTLSVARTLLVEIGGELYGFPVAHIARAVMVPRDGIQTLEGRQHFTLDGRAVGLVTAHQVLIGTLPPAADGLLAIIVVGDSHHTYGLVVDRLVGERELVVQPLDPALGKINGVTAAAVMDDGRPVLIVDTEDLVRTMNKVVAGGRVTAVPRAGTTPGARRRKRVLIVDDSLTVRELERKVLGNRGYDVEVAVDGMDGWNAVRTGHFDLVITDVDMPRMDGIELTTLISGHHRLQTLPVVVVSYKDREEDRQRGLEAGAVRYLTKGSFHEDALLQAVVDLIGEAGT